MVVGDVRGGHGVPAATTMASLRFAVLAYAAEGYGPAEVLAKLSHFAGEDWRGHFATVLCARLEVAEHRVTVASAGHLPPLVLSGAGADYLPLRVGVPIGAGASTYEQVTVAVPTQATLIAFTDGLVERRGEVLDAGLARLRSVAAEASPSLEDLLTTLVTELSVEGGHEDDTAILAVRWIERPGPERGAWHTRAPRRPGPDRRGRRSVHSSRDDRGEAACSRERALRRRTDPLRTGAGSRPQRVALSHEPDHHGRCAAPGRRARSSPSAGASAQRARAPASVPAGSLPHPPSPLADTANRLVDVVVKLADGVCGSLAEAIASLAQPVLRIVEQVLVIEAGDVRGRRRSPHRADAWSARSVS